MPRDVRTRWNSTFKMLQFALEHRKAVNELTGNQEYDLRGYELSKEEWVIVEQLCDVLKVSVFPQ